MSPCEMSSLVEARRDGRLSDKDLASLERHLASCATCASFAAELEDIADLARLDPPAPTELEHRRGRARLMRSAAHVEPERRTRWLPFALAPAILAVAAVGWAGTYLPTRQSARPDPAREGAAAAVAPVVIEASTSAAPAPEEEVAADAPAEPVPTAPPPRQAAAPRSADTTSGFNEAMRAFERGDYGEAEAKLRAFSAQNPRDARSEDAEFLAVVSLSKSGKTTSARAAARRYLDRYPSGIHRAEATAIANAK